MRADARRYPVATEKFGRVWRLLDLGEEQQPRVAPSGALHRPICSQIGPVRHNEGVIAALAAPAGSTEIDRPGTAARRVPVPCRRRLS